MISSLLAFLTALFLGLVIMPVVIKVAKMKYLVDEPTESRKVHKRSVPTIGGICIFATFLFSVSFWGGWEKYKALTLEDYSFFQYFIASILLLFFVGLKDDITGISPFKKLVAHIIVASIMVFFGNMRLTSMEGIFGLYELPYNVSVLLSIFTYIVVVNSVNLIDGIDGLAGGIGFIGALAFGIWFYLAGEIFFTLMSFALAGALLAFLVFNMAPARIFMGDSGSLVLGFVLCVLAMKLANFEPLTIHPSIKKVSQPVIAMAILAYPLLDTLRVFVIRIAKGNSPFSADKNHIHHHILKKGYSHKRASLILYVFAVILISVTGIAGKLEPTLGFIVMLVLGFALVQLLIFTLPSSSRK